MPSKKKPAKKSSARTKALISRVKKGAKKKIAPRLPGERDSEYAMRLTHPTKARGKAVAESSTAKVRRGKNEQGEPTVEFIPPQSGIIAVVCSKDPRHTDIDSHVIRSEFEKGNATCGCGAPLVQRQPE